MWVSTVFILFVQIVYIISIVKAIVEASHYYKKSPGALHFKTAVCLNPRLLQLVFLMGNFMIQIVFMLFVDINGFVLFYEVLSVFFIRFYLVLTNMNLSLATPVSKTFYSVDTFIHWFIQPLFILFYFFNWSDLKWPVEQSTTTYQQPSFVCDGSHSK